MGLLSQFVISNCLAHILSCKFHTMCSVFGEGCFGDLALMSDMTKVVNIYFMSPPMNNFWS